MAVTPVPIAPEPTDAELRRRWRQRNNAMLVLLVAVSALFFAITLVKLAKPGQGG